MLSKNSKEEVYIINYLQPPRILLLQSVPFSSLPDQADFEQLWSSQNHKTLERAGTGI